MSLPPPPTPDLRGLPTEIKRQIISKLEPVDKVCVGLAHSHLYEFVLTTTRWPILAAPIQRPRDEGLSLYGDSRFETLVRRLILYLPQSTITRSLHNECRCGCVLHGFCIDKAFAEEDAARARGWRVMEVGRAQMKQEYKETVRLEKEKAKRWPKEQNKMYWDERSKVIQKIKAMEKRKVASRKGMGKERMRRPWRKGFVSMMSMSGENSTI